MKPKSARGEKRDLETLIPFPKQAEFFGDLSDHELRQLADDIDRNGLHQKIEILPANAAGYKPDTILRGHQRLRALKLLGKKTTDVLVRYDLADATVDEIDQVFLEDNVNRRQLDPFEKVRTAIRLFEIRKKRPMNRRCAHERAQIRTLLGKVVGMGNRNLNRYVNAATTPLAVQDAFRAKKLTLIEVSKVALLPAKAQAQVATMITGGMNAREALSQHLPAKSSRHRNPNDALNALCKDLDVAHADLADRVDSVSERLIAEAMPSLRKGRKLIRRLIAKIGNQ